MDELLRPQLDFDDNDEEEADNPWSASLKPTLEGGKDGDAQIDMEKYFSNGSSTQEKPSSRPEKGRTSIGRYQEAADDGEEEGESTAPFGVTRRDSSDSDDIGRDGGPLSLEELDGWMKQVNSKPSCDENDSQAATNARH